MNGECGNQDKVQEVKGSSSHSDSSTLSEKALNSHSMQIGKEYLVGSDE